MVEKDILDSSPMSQVRCSTILSVQQGIRTQATSAAVMPPKLKQIVGQFQMVSSMRHSVTGMTVPSYIASARGAPSCCHHVVQTKLLDVHC